MREYSPARRERWAKFQEKIASLKNALQLVMVTCAPVWCGSVWLDTMKTYFEGAEYFEMNLAAFLEASFTSELADSMWLDWKAVHDEKPRADELKNMILLYMHGGDFAGQRSHARSKVIKIRVYGDVVLPQSWLPQAKPGADEVEEAGGAGGGAGGGAAAAVAGGGGVRGAPRYPEKVVTFLQATQNVYRNPKFPTFYKLLDDPAKLREAVYRGLEVKEQAQVDQREKDSNKKRKRNEEGKAAQAKKYTNIEVCTD